MTRGGSVAFEVRGDGVTLWRSGTMTSSSPTGSATVDVAGVSMLELVVDPLGHVGQDHADWANAWVACG